MLVTVLFIGLIVGPIVGFLSGLWGTAVYTTESKIKLHAGFVGWFLAGVVGLIVSAFTVHNAFKQTLYIDFFGIHVYGVVLGAWFSCVFGAISGVVSAKILAAQEK